MKIGFVSLGCPKNLVDGEVMLGIAREAGHEITPDATDADVLVVNTCAFIDSAKQESIDAILEMAAHKRDGNCTRLVVTGCLAERYRDELQQGDSGDRRGARHRRSAGNRDGDRGPATAIRDPRSGVPLTARTAPQFQRHDRTATSDRGPSDPRQASPADLHLRRRHAAPPDDAEALRLRQDRRRLRLHVRVLHHPDAARRISQPRRPSRSCAKRGRWPRAACANCC